MQILDPKKALVVLSGGQDSTTCLFWTVRKFPSVQTITFDYGQRHGIELESAAAIAREAGVKNRLIRLSGLQELGGSSLTGNEEVSGELQDNGLPNSFVPGRNLIFLSYAAAYAYQENIKHIVLGACETDFSGYPDCREDTLVRATEALSMGMEADFELHTPLMSLTKAQSVVLAKEVGAFQALRLSHTCYNGVRPPCGDCPACLLRARGFQEAGEEDPLLADS